MRAEDTVSKLSASSRISRCGAERIGVRLRVAVKYIVFMMAPRKDESSYEKEEKLARTMARWSIRARGCSPRG